ncbi:hypothetical protein DEU32_108106 [Curtobacterium sp. AG1037]|uniref:hypothetical protein n=1 Tax=Curtobacterium sp. AG1037 TaxID=2183990 RepID=UPI000E2C3F21|nr:hypothetical protein [Curtobacterium sp. AG1037]RDH96939.1 hypothetical protein DEU32_108106 [Curtobacterium sp. AG1037]
MPQPDEPDASTRSEPAALARARALAVLAAAAPGDRLVVRAHHGDGARDALGELVARTPTTVSIATRRGTVVVPLDVVVAAKSVPPPPAPRPRRT